MIAFFSQKRWFGKRQPRRNFVRHCESVAAITESLEPRLLLTTDEALWAKAEMMAAQAPATVPAVSQPDSTVWAGFCGFWSGAGTGLWNTGVGAVSVGQNLVTMPIDLIGTTADMTYTLATGQTFNYQPISWYGQASQAAIQSGTPWYYVSGQTAANAATFGVYGLLMTGYYYYQTGDPTAFQQATGAFVFTVGIAYGAQYYAQNYANPANAPTYNLGGTGEVPGAINVQPPGAPIPPDPALIAPSNALPIPPGSGNVIVNSSPIAPQPGLATLGPPYSPAQISGIATGGYTITITQGVLDGVQPGVPTIGQTAVMNVAPPGSLTTVTAAPPYSTTVTITTPTPISTTVAPYVPIVIQAPNDNLPQNVPASQQ